MGSNYRLTDLPTPEDLPAQVAPRGAQHDLVSRAILGRYAVLDTIGAGGSGEILCVRDPNLEREIAAKVLRKPDRPELLAKFVREAQITGQLEHPGIVPVHELGRTREGQLYFTMKRIAGTTLEQRLDAAPPLSLSHLLNVFCKVCETVAFAHSRNVVHRDLKPDNIMLGEFGEVYVMDWGLAKRLGPDPEHPADATTDPLSVPGQLAAEGVAAGATMDGTLLGTPAYMSPEQAEGRVADIDARSDVYALGAILYRMLAGVPAYEGSSVWMILSQVCAGPPPPPSVRAPERAIPRALDRAVARAMATDPAHRHPDALMLKGEVEAFLTSGVTAAIGRGYSAFSTRTRRWAWQLPAAALIFGLALGALAFRSPPPAASAEPAAPPVAPSPPPPDPAALAAARDAVVRAGLEALLAQAEAAAAMDEQPTVAQAERARAVLSALHGGVARLDQLAALAPAEARPAQSQVQHAIARLAESTGQLDLARHAWLTAAALDPADSAATAGLARLDRRESAARAASVERVAALLAAAIDGRMSTADQLATAVAEVQWLRQRETVDQLVAVVAETAGKLRHTTRTALVEAAQPREVERAAGEIELAGLGAVADQWLTLAPLEAPPLIGEALARIARRSGLPGTAEAGRAHLARLQAAQLRAGGFDRARAARFACEALGGLGEGDGVLEALEELIRADWSEERAAHAGAALARLAARYPAARTRLLGVAGPDAPAHSRHFPTGGPFWDRCGALLGDDGTER